jgi:hypothetical protein
MKKEPYSFFTYKEHIRCFWCDHVLLPQDALIDLRSGKVKCKECSDYDQAVRLAEGK